MMNFAGYLGGNKTTYNGQTGYLLENSNIYMFNYARDGKLVIITSTDGSIFKDVVI